VGAEPDSYARSPVLGVECFAGDLETVAQAVVSRALSKQGGYACLCNVLVTARHSGELRQALDAAWMNVPDGAPVAWWQRRAGVESAGRIGGPDLMPRVVERGQAVGLRHFLFGSTPQVLQLLRRRLEETYRDVQIVGALAPPFGLWTDAERASTVATIRSASPDVIWCALGAPKQELWMARHASALSPAVVLGVGAAFDFVARTKPRAPVWMQRAGLEWLHRLEREPRRLAWRYLRTNAEFVALAAFTFSAPERRR